MIRTVEKRKAYRVLVGKRDGRDHFEDIATYGRIILKRTLTIED